MSEGEKNIFITHRHLNGSHVLSLTKSQFAEVNGLSAASRVPNLGKTDGWKAYILVKALAFFHSMVKGIVLCNIMESVNQAVIFHLNLD